MRLPKKLNRKLIAATTPTYVIIYISYSLSAAKSFRVVEDLTKDPTSIFERILIFPVFHKRAPTSLFLEARVLKIDKTDAIFNTVVILGRV